MTAPRNPFYIAGIFLLPFPSLCLMTFLTSWVKTPFTKRMLIKVVQILRLLNSTFCALFFHFEVRQPELTPALPNCQIDFLVLAGFLRSLRSLIVVLVGLRLALNLTLLLALELPLGLLI